MSIEESHRNIHNATGNYPNDQQAAVLMRRGIVHQQAMSAATGSAYGDCEDEVERLATVCDDWMFRYQTYEPPAWKLFFGKESPVQFTNQASTLWQWSVERRCHLDMSQYLTKSKSRDERSCHPNPVHCYDLKVPAMSE